MTHFKKFSGLLLMIILLSLISCEKKTNDKIHDNVEQKNSEKVGRLPDFTHLVEKIGPTVVNIRAYNKKENDSSIHSTPQSDSELLQEFFQVIIPELEKNEKDNEDSIGSGFIISKDGYIVTNTHVIENRNTIKVITNDKKEFNAYVIGLDKDSDIALLKINEVNLPIVTIGSTKNLRVGQWIAALGSPFGFENSLTAGIISALKRTFPDEVYLYFIQSDVAINQGNSGGPLLNLKGEVIGVNSQIYSESGGFVGISFSIPIDIVMNVVEQLKNKGYVERSQIGANIQALSYDLAKTFGLNEAKGAVTVSIIPNSPAEKAGVQIGDIILSVNGEPVNESSDLPLTISSIQPGTEIDLTIWRDKKELNLKAKLAKLNNNVTMNMNSVKNIFIPRAYHKESTFKVVEIDSIFAKISEETARNYKLKSGIILVKSGKKAQALGFLPGDIVISIGNKIILNTEDLTTSLKEKKNVPVYLIRDGAPIFIPYTGF